jgi:predicted Zn-dependent protease
MAFEDFRLERFEMLNGLGRNAPLAPGRKVKIIAE